MVIFWLHTIHTCFSMLLAPGASRLVRYPRPSSEQRLPHAPVLQLTHALLLALPWMPPSLAFNRLALLPGPPAALLEAEVRETQLRRMRADPEVCKSLVLLQLLAAWLFRKLTLHQVFSPIMMRLGHS
ncbi:hypothetical protein IWX90DRAFT_206923 [Phyllosticta citrichinensis]|uniref:Uncharacterized protein n=1 Tax=Phyllosticta citrichinensis TaxID=1130410 RepID=A0ABR1XSJ5_9PEZI